MFAPLRWLFLIVFTLTPVACGQPAELRQAAIGITSRDAEIPVHLVADAEKVDQRGGRVLIIGGHDGELESVQMVEALRRNVLRAEPAIRQKSRVSFIPNVYPSGLGRGNDSASAVRGYPPEHGYYNDRARPESRYLWRWVGMYGPDLVIDIRLGKEVGYWLPKDVPAVTWLHQILPRDWKKLPAPADDDFVLQLSKTGVGDLGTIPAIVLQLPASAGERELKNIELLVQLAHTLERSPARRELIRREQRSPNDVSLELAKSYLSELSALAKIDTEYARSIVNAPSVVGMYYDGWIDDLKKLEAGGFRLDTPRWLFAEKPDSKSDDEIVAHLLPIAALLQETSRGWINMRDKLSDPDSDRVTDTADSLFTVTPILAATGRLSSQPQFLQAAVAHFGQMKKLCRRDDGLYRHSPQCDVAWGRANGYVAVGLARTLDEIPRDHPARDQLNVEFEAHITALLKHQDAFGCWHQVIDKPGSYREFSATCLIAWAIKRGLDRGWLDKAKCRLPLERAWNAVKQRVGPDGKVVDACIGTGQQKTLRDYYDRPAIWGIDARSGTMALLLATEMMDAKWTLRELSE